ncbi:MAG: NUDIX hydrolase [Clostridia bacterium]|nr:NUDIX hydrolase [Clostridia bacterium]
MEFKNIRKEYQGDYITYYKIRYETEGGNEKIYEMISRDPAIESQDDLNSKKPDAVIMIVHDSTGEKLLLNFEYRMAVGEWVYNFPAGLIDSGETVVEAAARELREETGLRLTQIKDIWKESYSAVGFSNEKGSVVIAAAEGTIQKSDSEAEEIKAAWYTKDEVRFLLSEYRFAARTQAYCALWSC